MKFRLTALVVLLSLSLAACSLAEDITPPPDYETPTSAPTAQSATLTPIPTKSVAPTQTQEPATATVEPVAGSLTPSADANGAQATPLGTFSGTLDDASGGTVSAGQPVTLLGFEQDQSGNFQQVAEMTGETETDGSYSFEDVEIPTGRAFLVVANWDGVTYQSSPQMVQDGTSEYSIPLTVYDATDDFSVLMFDQVHVVFAQSQDVVQVTEVFIISNPGTQTVVVASDGSSVPFIQLPEDASGEQYQLAQGSAPLLNATGGFAMTPGNGQQYGIIVAYALPYSRNLKFSQPFSQAVTNLDVFVPEGMQVRSAQLTDGGAQAIQNQNYQMYEGSDFTAGNTLAFTLSSASSALLALNFPQQTWVLVGIGAAGVLLIGLGVFLFMRERSRLKEEDEEDSEDEAGEGRDDLLDAIVVLDQQYEAGEISEDAYQEQRQRLKEQLKEETE
jgi:hypothetical protein